MRRISILTILFASVSGCIGSGSGTGSLVEGEDGDTCGEPHPDCPPDDGTCVPSTPICPAVVDPVCGCDGVTYHNTCLADAACVSIVHPGACEDECVPGEACGDPCPVLCPDGTCARPGEPCASTCDVVCPDGTCAPAGSTCGDTCTPCPDGTCAPPGAECAPSDCRVMGCPDGTTCSFCWVGYECLPPGTYC